MIFARWTFLPLLLSLKSKDYDDDTDSDYDDAVTIFDRYKGRVQKKKL